MIEVAMKHGEQHTFLRLSITTSYGNGKIQAARFCDCGPPALCVHHRVAQPAFANTLKTMARHPGTVPACFLPPPAALILAPSPPVCPVVCATTHVASRLMRQLFFTYDAAPCRANPLSLSLSAPPHPALAGAGTFPPPPPHPHQPPHNPKTTLP